MQNRDAAFQGWVLYDDSCGFCRKWVPFWKKTLNARGFEIAPLQSDWVRGKIKLSPAELMEDLRLLLPSGQQIQGAEVYRCVLRRIRWAFPIYLLSIAPITRFVFDWSYRTFARNRFHFSKACGLQKKYS